MPGRVRLTSDAVAEAALPVIVTKKRPPPTPVPNTTALPPAKKREVEKGCIESEIKRDKEVLPDAEPIAETLVEEEPEPSDGDEDYEPPEKEEQEETITNSPKKPPTTSRASSTTPAAKVERRRLKYPCDEPNCDKVFTRPCRLEEHKRSHTGERPFKCAFEGCDKAFLRDQHLKAHIACVHEKEKPHRCTFLIPVGSEHDLGRWSFKRKAPTPFSVDEEGDGVSVPSTPGELRECGATFALKIHLKRHIQSHEKPFPHMCTEYPPCKEGFRQKGQLQRHIRAEHLRLLPFTCSHMLRDDPKKRCEASFATKGKLASHIVLAHNTANRYICSICTTENDSAKIDRQLSGSLASGVGGLSKESDNDGEASNEPTSAVVAAPSEYDSRETRKEEPLAPISLELNTSVETDIPTTDDSTAEMTTNTTENISQLAEVNTPITEDPFPIIQKSITPPDPATARSEGIEGFATATELRHHIETAHPPVCDTCGYIAKRHRDLVKHQNDKHVASLEERQKFRCEFPGCPKKFTKRHALKGHFQTVHEGLRPFICPHEGCGKKYAQKCWMKKHFKTKHTDTPPPPPPQKRQRKRLTKPMSLIEELTGVGYESTGRFIDCLVDGCQFKFARVVDLKVHLGAVNKGHGFKKEQVEELTAGMKADGTREDMDDDDDDESEEWSVADDDEDDE